MFKIIAAKLLLKTTKKFILSGSWAAPDERSLVKTDTKKLLGYFYFLNLRQKFLVIVLSNSGELRRFSYIGEDVFFFHKLCFFIAVFSDTQC